jgi:cytochrome c556
MADNIVKIDFGEEEPKKKLLKLPKIFKKDKPEDKPEENLSESEKLEKEIEQKQKLLAIRKKEEEIRKQEEFIAQQKTLIAEQEKIKENEQVDVVLEPFKTFDVKQCPKCHRRFKLRGLIRSKVKKEGNSLKQTFKCRDKNCDFVKVVILGD